MSATLDECFRGDDIESPTDTYTSNNRNNQSKGPIAGAVAGARNGSRKGLIATSFTKKAFNHTEAHLSPDPFGYNIDLEDIDAEGLQGEREGEDEDKGEECDGLEEGGRSGVSAMAVAVAVTHMGRSGRGLLSGRKYVSTSGNGSDTGNKQGRVNANTTTNTATTATAATTNTKATTTNKKSNLAQNMKMKTSTV